MSVFIIPNFTGKRWLKLSLRTFHLIGFAGVFASFIADSPQIAYWLITIVSGVGLLVLEAFSNLIWFIQVRGLVMYVKFLLLGLVFIYPQYAWHLFIGMIILSGVISHAPSSVRYYSIFHGKKITSVNDIKG